MKLNIFIKKFIIVGALWFFFLPVNSEEKQISSDEHKFNFYSGMFDFSDNGKRATVKQIFFINIFNFIKLKLWFFIHYSHNF